MVDQIADFKLKLGIVFIFGGDDRFRSFFAHLLKDFVYPFIKR